MSQTETHFGKLKKVEINKPIEEWCKDQCSLLGRNELPKYYRDWKEYFKDITGYNTYFFVKEEVWKAIEHTKIDEGADIDIITVNEDGTVSFVQQFYNGGTCLSECLEEGLINLNKK